ncbi:MAG: MotA/TolQ/ExbB proton channel family protein [Pirellulaceae bacterium]
MTAYVMQPTKPDTAGLNLAEFNPSCGNWLHFWKRGKTVGRDYYAPILLAIVCGMSMVNEASAQAPPPNGFGSSYGAPPPPLPTDQPAARLATAPTYSSAGQPTDPTSLGGGNMNSSAEESSIQMGNIVSIIREGGVLMFPIVGCSIVLLVFVFERGLFLRRGRIIPRPFVRGVIEQLEQQQLDRDEAISLCEENGSPIAELFTAALKKWGKPAVEVEQAVLDAGERVTSQLRKYLRLLNAISNLSPLLGLLGTVLGMIDAFNTIARADAMGRPELLAAGIGAALLTTAAGLCVAIPAYAAYAFFVGRTDQLILEMDALAQNVVEQISAEALQSGPGRSRGRSRKAA